MSKTSILSVACVLAIGCADTIPPELVDARQAYVRAQQGPAAKHNPAGLHEAQQALVKAEAMFEDEGATFKARDNAYIAARKAKIAEIHARTIESDKQASQIKAQVKAMENAALARLGSTQQMLESERARRQQAETSAEQARNELARVAQVAENERGTVVTIPGGVLFASGKSVLLPSAEAKLSQVAQALVASNPDAMMEVEGHTDSRGSEQFNQRLSEQRAQSVREYLVSHGISPDRVTAKGLGESRPIANNESPEGRANNRRVEIVVRRSDAGATSGPQGAVPGESGQGTTGTTGSPGMRGNTSDAAKSKGASGTKTPDSAAAPGMGNTGSKANQGNRKNPSTTGTGTTERGTTGTGTGTTGTGAGTTSPAPRAPDSPVTPPTSGGSSPRR